MDIGRKSIGQLIDELGTTLIRCWFAQEKVMQGGTDVEVAQAAKNAQQLNARRNQLIRAIDERLGEAEFTPPEKSYQDKRVAENRVAFLERKGFKVWEGDEHKFYWGNAEIGTAIGSDTEAEAWEACWTACWEYYQRV